VNHSDIQSRMASYLDGELSLDARALFDAHLDQCDACSRELAEMRGTIRLLRSLPTPEPPPDLVSNVMSRIAEGEGQPDWIGRVMDQLSRVFVPRIAIPVSAVAAALTLTVVSGDLSLRSLNPRVRPEQSEIAGISLNVRGNDHADAALPVSARVSRVNMRARSQSPVPVRVARPTPQLRYRGESGAGSFLFRVANDQLGPIRRQPKDGDSATRYLFTGSSPRVGPYLGASAAPPITLGRGQYIVGTATALPNSGETLERTLAQAAVSRSTVVPGGGQAELSSERRREQVLDEQLTALVSDPPGFAHRQAKRTLAEQEHWLQQMAARAAEKGDVERVMNALTGSGDTEAVELAREFSRAVVRNGEGLANAKATSGSE